MSRRRRAPRVTDADEPKAAMPETVQRKRDYLEGFLKQQPAARRRPSRAATPMRAIIEALKEIYDPEIPVNIYDLGLIYGVEVTPDGHAAVTMTLTTPPLSGRRIPCRARSRCASARCRASAMPRSIWSGTRPGIRRR